MSYAFEHSFSGAVKNGSNIKLNDVSYKGKAPFPPHANIEKSGKLSLCTVLQTVWQESLLFAV